MVLHILRGDPALRDFEHIQVDSPGMAYLFFYDKQGHSGLKQDATETLRAHVAEAFLEWISHCAHFVIIVLLAEDWQRATSLQIGLAKGPEQSTLTALCPTWFLVSQTPCRCWWGAPHPVLPRCDKLRKGMAVPPGCLPHSQEEDPPKGMPHKGWCREFTAIFSH